VAHSCRVFGFLLVALSVLLLQLPPSSHLPAHCVLCPPCPPVAFLHVTVASLSHHSVHARPHTYAA
jgi:hypothetical protein